MVSNYRKYELNKEKISDFIEDFINLDDWIPFYVTINLPPGVCFDQMQNAKDKSLLSDKYYNHSSVRDEFNRNHKYIEETLDWEIEEFLNKYPNFKPLFHINTEYEYGCYKNKYQRKNNLISRTLRKIFTF